MQSISKTRIQGLKSHMRGIKKTGSVEEYLTKLRNVAKSLAALDYPVSDDDYVQAIIEGLTKEYHGFTASVMAKFGSFSTTEAKSFLQAYDEMIHQTKNLGQPLPVANLTQQYFQPIQRGGGRRGRGGRFNRGGRNSWQNN
ncbi:hypothetical protein PIB30_018787 [Stylosanthes scabra]|uniref:Uncharacterized protein n=1 Tax=Stylosanthes scabra TaxID=79078 RepID=A0ABU6R8B7_9FABA|nr:hypothetical protein [Stylosanthes scabra]